MTRQAKQLELMKARGWVTCPEAAELIDYHPTAVYKLVKQDRVVSTKVGSTIYISITSLRDLLGGASEAMLGPVQDFESLAVPTPAPAEEAG